MVWMLLFDIICLLIALGSSKFPMLAKTYVTFVSCFWVGWTAKPALKTVFVAVGSQVVVAVCLLLLVPLSACAFGHLLAAACGVDVWGPSGSKC
jgi:hypothetical protein